MPTTVRTVIRLYNAVALLLIVVAALVVAVFALVGSNSTAGCVNRVLGERAKATSIETDAKYRATRAEVLYLRGNLSRAALLDVKSAELAAQRDATAYRQKHPAGRC